MTTHRAEDPLFSWVTIVSGLAGIILAQVVLIFNLVIDAMGWNWLDYLLVVFVTLLSPTMLLIGLGSLWRRTGLSRRAGLRLWCPMALVVLVSGVGLMRLGRFGFYRPQDFRAPQWAMTLDLLVLVVAALVYWRLLQKSVPPRAA